MSQAPQKFDDFLSTLNTYNINEFDESLAHLLRIHASTRFFGTIMTVGTATLPYMPWLVDGMNMSNKLIVQVDKGNEVLNDAIKTTTDSDIRITSHCQNQDEFTTDIIEHRLDLIVLSEEAMPIFENWINLLSETGMLIMIAGSETRNTLLEKHANDYFCFDDGKHLTICQKGKQHKKVRRRSRLRRAASD